MGFTGRDNNIGGSGFARAAVGRNKATRIVYLGDSMMGDQNPGRLWHGLNTMSLPRRFNGFGRSGFAAGADTVLVSAVNSAPLTSAVTPDPVTAFGSPYTYGTVYASAKTGLFPQKCWEFTFGTNVAADLSFTSCALFPWQVHGTDGNTGTGADPYSNVGQARTPFWWMLPLRLTVIWHDPSVALHGVDGPNVYIKSGRTNSGTTKDLVVGNLAGGSGTIRYARSTIAAAAYAYDYPKIELVTNGIQSSKRCVVLGFFMEVASPTYGSAHVTLGNPGYRAGDWADTTAVQNATLSKYAEAIGGVDAFCLCLGHNLTGTQDTQLGTGNLTQTIADITADITRLRTDFGDVPCLLWGPYKYNPAQSATKYDNFVDAMYQVSLQVPRVGLANIYHGVGDNAAFIDATGGQAVMTNRFVNASDRHLIAQGSQAFASYVWQMIHDADELTGLGGSASKMSLRLS